MSRNVTVQTEITNKDLAIQAMDRAGISYQIPSEGYIKMTSGPATNAVIDLEKGTITGDSDFGHTFEKLGILRQYYSEALVRAEYLKAGTVIDGRQTDENGNLILMWHMA